MYLNGLTAISSCEMYVDLVAHKPARVFSTSVAELSTSRLQWSFLGSSVMVHCAVVVGRDGARHREQMESV